MEQKLRKLGIYRNLTFLKRKPIMNTVPEFAIPGEGKGGGRLAVEGKWMVDKGEWTVGSGQWAVDIGR